MSAPPGRRGTLVVGLFVILMGTMIFLAAANIIPQPDKKFGAPRWMVALIGLAFFLAGWYVVSLALPAPRTGHVLATATALTFITSMAIFLTWSTLTGAEGWSSSLSVGPLTLFLPQGLTRSIDRVVIGFFALLVDVYALVAWYGTLRSFVRRRGP
jgi:hypothetical protein